MLSVMMKSYSVIEFKSVLDKVLINAEYDIDTFSGGSSLYEAFLKSPFDLVFLDIEMPAVDGITLAKSLRAMSEKVFIVFLTSHVEYAIVLLGKSHGWRSLVGCSP